MAQSPSNSMAHALIWISRITTVGLEMVLPAIAGQWLDSKLQTSFLGVVGLVFGVIAGFWHLMVMTRPRSSRPDKPGQDNPSS